MNTQCLKKIFVSFACVLIVASGYFGVRKAQALDTAQSKADISQARVLDYEGLVEIRRGGKLMQMRKGLSLKKGDDITVYYDSFLELTMDRKKEVILRIEGESNFVFEQILQVSPFGLEVRHNQKTNTTESVMIFNEEAWYKRYAELLQKGKVPYTVVIVKEGLVAAESLGLPTPKEVLVKPGQMTFVFQGKPPLAPLPWEEYIDMCIEDCWEDW